MTLQTLDSRTEGFTISNSIDINFFEPKIYFRSCALLFTSLQFYFDKKFFFCFFSLNKWKMDQIARGCQGPQTISTYEFHCCETNLHRLFFLLFSSNMIFNSHNFILFLHLTFIPFPYFFLGHVWLPKMFENI